MKALRLLTEAYIDMCGISLGFRTVVYCAAEAWVERLAWLDLPLSEMARKEPLVCLMPHITDLYKPEIYDRYDIAGMGDPELLAACRRIIVEKTFDEATTEVLCWGILKATEEKEELSQEGGHSRRRHAAERCPDRTELSENLGENDIAFQRNPYLEKRTCPKTRGTVAAGL